MRPNPRWMDSMAILSCRHGEREVMVPTCWPGFPCPSRRRGGPEKGERRKCGVARISAGTWGVMEARFIETSRQDASKESSITRWQMDHASGVDAIMQLLEEWALSVASTGLKPTWSEGCGWMLFATRSFGGRSWVRHLGKVVDADHVRHDWLLCSCQVATASLSTVTAKSTCPRT